MNARPAPVTVSGRRRSRPRRLGWLAMLVAVAALLALSVNGVVQRLGLPLADAPIIRAQAHAKHLDPALIAAVIYAESKFDARTSRAGALGLMQILPSTARYLARLSGGATFTVADLAQPAVNISYGSYYLRYLLDRYHGVETLALAAYNGGATNVDRWLSEAHRSGRPFTTASIRFPETRAYVIRVEQAQRDYRARYGAQLGT